MNEKFIADRITELRLKKNVSEYQMSLDLGRNKTYIQSITSGRNLPKMSHFFDIYLKPTGCKTQLDNKEYSKIYIEFSNLRKLCSRRLCLSHNFFLSAKLLNSFIKIKIHKYLYFFPNYYFFWFLFYKRI